jgi:uncharacterized protein (DUF924 family)
MNEGFQIERQEEILYYWFGSLENDNAPSDRHVKMWFSNRKEMDADIKFRFELDLKRALEGKLNSWLDISRGSLAFIILIDQFSRNIYRGTPKAFEGDSIALKACLNGIENGFDINLHPIERLFYYMPLMHSEDLEIQMTSLECFTMLEKLFTSPPSIASLISTSKMYAEKHYLMIEKFGRFPHRNKIIGRSSTPEELKFLTDSGCPF